MWVGVDPSLLRDHCPFHSTRQPQDGEIKQLKETIKQMKRQANTQKAFSQLPKWRSPTTNVFDRLHQDSCLRLASSKPRISLSKLASIISGRHLVGVWIGGVWNGHFPESQKDFSEAEISRKMPEILQKERFSFAPQNAIPASAIPYPH